jgi:hypothetical protein
MSQLTAIGPIAAVRPASRAEWKAALEDERSTFFHGPVWSEVWEAYTDGRYRPDALHVTFTDGRNAVLAITMERMGLGVRRRWLSPAGTYGGWLSTTPLSDDQIRALVEMIEAEPGVIWRRSPLDRTRGSSNQVQDLTHIIDLRDGADAALARWKGSARREIVRAKRLGITAHPGAASDWAGYDQLYRLSLERWGSEASSRYESKLFALLQDADPASVRLWIASKAGQPVAGAIVFIHRSYAIQWHGAWVASDAPGATNLLQAEIIRALAEEGITTYDLNPSGGHSGVAMFKASIGAAPAKAPITIIPHPREEWAIRSERWRQRLGFTRASPRGEG